VHLHWQILTRWHYDLIQNQTVEALGGVEYNGCCLALQLVTSRYRQSTNYFYPDKFATGIFGQIVFKGLSSVGFNTPDSKLKSKIPGYIPLYQRQRAIPAVVEHPLLDPTDIPLYSGPT